MIEAIKRASEQLRVAWDEYLRVCLDLNTYSWQEKTYYDTPRGFLQEMDNELVQLSHYEKNAQMARSIIKKAHSRGRHLVPVHALPSEILLRVFDAVQADLDITSPTYRYSYNNISPGDQSIDRIAQVCSHWRNVAISCPFLWRHIDISLAQKSVPRLLHRVGMYVQRSADLPLQIHIYCTRIYKPRRDYDPLVEFLERIAYRLGALELVIRECYDKYIYLSALEAILTNCSPKTFKYLTTHADSSISPYVFSEIEDDLKGEDADDSDAASYTPFGGFSGLAVLNLNGCYPYWSSLAYHGLVDLRLAPSPDFHADIPTIDKMELIYILTASPLLRIFHFNLELSALETEDTAATPIPLKDLEVVNLSMEVSRRGTWLYKIGSLLSLLAPGSKPLRLTLDLSEDQDGFINSVDELHAFLARSNVEKLCFRHVNLFSKQLFAHTPDVKVLVLEGCYCAETYPDAADSGYDASLMLPRLQSCYVLGGGVLDSILYTLAELCPSGLILDVEEVRTRAYYGSIGIDKIPTIFPTAKCVPVRGWARLTADWDILD